MQLCHTRLVGPGIGGAAIRTNFIQYNILQRQNVTRIWESLVDSAPDPISHAVSVSAQSTRRSGQSSGGEGRLAHGKRWIDDWEDGPSSVSEGKAATGDGRMAPMSRGDRRGEKSDLIASGSSSTSGSTSNREGRRRRSSPVGRAAGGGHVNGVIPRDERASAGESTAPSFSDALTSSSEQRLQDSVRRGLSSKAESPRAIPAVRPRSAARADLPAPSSTPAMRSYGSSLPSHAQVDPEVASERPTGTAMHRKDDQRRPPSSASLQQAGRRVAGAASGRDGAGQSATTTGLPSGSRAARLPNHREIIIKGDVRLGVGRDWESE